jgi:uncharacterized protein YeaO (DUF488 family)
MIRIVRLGSPRQRGEGVRIGTVRRPPRGVKKADFARLDYYDVWMPDLAPSAPIVTWAMSEPWTLKRWQAFAKKYRSEMKRQQHLLALLAAMSKQTDFSVGCYCEDESRCHRSLLREMLTDLGASVHD